MSVYLPPAFDERDLARLDALAAAHPFASLITVDDGAPRISHVPVLYHRVGDSIAVTGHLARPNPQVFHRGSALLVLRGPQAYVSPGWYPDKTAQARVPTWNYVVAHLSGELAWFDDEAGLAALVGRLSEAHEARVGGSWHFDVDDSRERVQLRGIVGFRLDVAGVEMKAKRSQNHPDDNRRAVIARLERSDDGDDRDVAAWMRETFDAPEGA